MFDSTLELAAHIPDSLKEGFEKPAMTIEEKRSWTYEPHFYCFVSWQTVVTNARYFILTYHMIMSEKQITLKQKQKGKGGRLLLFAITIKLEWTAKFIYTSGL